MLTLPKEKELQTVSLAAETIVMKMCIDSNAAFSMEVMLFREKANRDVHK